MYCKHTKKIIIKVNLLIKQQLIVNYSMRSGKKLTPVTVHFQLT